MDKCARFLGRAVLGIAIVSMLLPVALASDECVNEPPNPFLPVAMHTESIGSKWRHGFHKVRTTWEKYFEVFPHELKGFEPVIFEKVRAEPVFYLDRKIQTDIFLGKSGQFYRPFISPFHADGYVNFSGWDYAAELWNKDDRGRIHPFFYIDKRRQKLVDKMAHIPMFTPIHIWAEVRSISDKKAWIEITGAEIIPETVLSESALRYIEAGVSQINQKRTDMAAQFLEAALKLELPVQAEAKVYAALGFAYADQRSYSLARNALASALIRNENNLKNLILLARSDTYINKFEEAQQAAERAIALEPTNPEAHAELGLALALQGDVQGGNREVDIAQKLAPRNLLPEANRNRAMIALLVGNLELARTELYQAVNLRATDFALHLELGDVLMALNQLDEAKREYSQARDLAPLRSEPFYKVAVLVKTQADILAKDGKKEDAAKLYNEALENVKKSISKNVHFAPAYGLESEILQALDRDADAKKVLEQGASSNPGSSAIQDSFYQLAASTRDWVGMEQATRAALAIRSDAVHQGRLGNILASRPSPDFKGAVIAYADAARLDPENAEYSSALGDIRINFLGEWATGEAALLQAVKLDPHNAGAWYNLGQARRNLGNLDGAVQAADEAARLSNGVHNRIFSALTHLEHGDISIAAEIAQKVVIDSVSQDDKSRAQSVYAATLLQNGKLEEALEAFAGADAGVKANAEHHLWYGQALTKSGDLAAATEHFQSAIEIIRSAPQSQATVRIQTQAEKSLKNTAQIAKARSKADAEAKKEVVTVDETEKAPLEAANPDKNDQTSVAKTAPIIEEPETIEPVPIEVPGPR